MAGEQDHTAEKLAATREDLAEFRGAVLERLDSLQGSMGHVLTQWNSMMELVQHHGSRLDVLEAWRQQQDEAAEAHAQDARAHRRWLAGWIIAVLAVVAEALRSLPVPWHHN